MLRLLGLSKEADERSHGAHREISRAPSPECENNYVGYKMAKVLFASTRAD